jgi:hypothetical protein
MHYRSEEYEGGGELGIEQSGGVFRGRPGPKRGCSAIPRWMVYTVPIKITHSVRPPIRNNSRYAEWIYGKFNAAEFQEIVFV